MQTHDQVIALEDAMWQLLDDMGDDQCVSLAAKAQARLAYEPFRDPNIKMHMTIEQAQAIVKECREYN